MNEKEEHKIPAAYDLTMNIVESLPLNCVKALAGLALTAYFSGEVIEKQILDLLPDDRDLYMIKTQRHVVERIKSKQDELRRKER